MFSQQPWDCISSIHQRTPRHTALPRVCASWWCQSAPSPTCHGWGTLHRQWAYCTSVLGNAKLSPVHLLLLNDGALALLVCWNGFLLSHIPVMNETGIYLNKGSWRLSVTLENRYSKNILAGLQKKKKGKGTRLYRVFVLMLLGKWISICGIFTCRRQLDISYHLRAVLSPSLCFTELETGVLVEKHKVCFCISQYIILLFDQGFKMLIKTADLPELCLF